MVVSALVSVAVVVLVGRDVLADDADRRLDRAVGLAERSEVRTDVAGLQGFGRIVVPDASPVGSAAAPDGRDELVALVREAVARSGPVERRIEVDGRTVDARAVPERGTVPATALVASVSPHDATARSLLTRVVIVQLGLLAVLVVLAALVSRRSTRLVESLFQQEDHLMRSVAHELRNPLGRALVAVDEGLSGESPPGEALTEAATLVVSADELIGDLLEMARVMTGGIELPREVVALDRVAAEAVAMSSLGSCTVDLEVAPTAISGSARLLRRAVSNLVRNAAAHAYAGGPGVIRVRVDAGGVAVADDGPGVPEPELRALRFEERLGPDERGAGLGLNLCGWVAELHGGRLVLANGQSERIVAALSLPAYAPGRKSAPVTRSPAATDVGDRSDRTAPA